MFNPFAKPEAKPAQPVQPAAQSAVNPGDDTQPPAHAANPANQPDPNKASDPNNPEHGTNPGSANQIPTPQNPSKSPLDIYDDMFHNKPAKGDKPVDLTLNIPDEAMDKVMENVDFSKSISPELMTKFQSGDVGAVMEVMQVMSKQAYRTAMQHGAAVANSNLNLRGEQLDGQIGKIVQSNLSSDAVINSDIPNIDHPAVKREVQRVAAQLREANPTATASQIAQGTKNYFQELRAAMTPEAQPSAAEQAQAAQDWSNVDDWLGDEA